ncbi:PREDICTED: uncharacterized protein LOC108562097 [Nicrophorus vespilloides]|uniref:Uncharacterized protein LOC108562097 n=1 Tax=Nicrophorus vespilloides TaxID=110193 RepID=A0ABM1MMJ1_NICVS|nr:PREDICTED: uncharacterized protein LOC108562097 [Nicrophorus vespilloides]
MKTLLAVLVISTISLVSSSEFKYKGKPLEQLIEARNKCFVSENVDASYLDKLDQIEYPTRDEIQCHTYCVLSSFKIINDKGEVFPEIVMKYIKEPVQQKLVIDTINTCILRTKKSENACDRAHQMQACFNSIIYKKN